MPGRPPGPCRAREIGRAPGTLPRLPRRTGGAECGVERNGIAARTRSGPCHAGALPGSARGLPGGAGFATGRAEAGHGPAPQKAGRPGFFSFFGGGIFWGRPGAQPRGPSPDVAQLTGQVEALRQLVTLSLLQEQSPSSRLRGVTYSYQMARPDAQVEQALLYAVNHDSNVNVRLSAVDALEKYTASPRIRRALADAVPVQDSPLVQIALMDLLVQLNDKEAAPALRQLAQDAQADNQVRQYAAWAIQRMEVSQ